MMSDAPLNKLVAQINGHLERFEHAGPEDDEQRISVGLLLIAARDSVQRGKWYDWLKANIKRSIRDCQKAIAVAHAPDPHRKLAEQRKKNRQYALRHRKSLTPTRREHYRPAAVVGRGASCSSRAERHRSSRR